MSRMSVRWVTTFVRKPSIRKGRKGHLYGPNEVHPPATPEEEVRIIRRRMEKAERDERMDITNILTPPKTYMGGFTRPRDLRTLMWFPGGPYESRGKAYESPPETAYHSHTVFLLESRYPVKYGIGRVDAYDHVVGCCVEGNLEAVLQRYNSMRAPSDQLQSMDNARWPWRPQKKQKRVKWWDDDEDPEGIIRELHGEVDPSYLESSNFSEIDEEEAKSDKSGIEQRIRNPRRLLAVIAEETAQESGGVGLATSDASLDASNDVLVTGQSNASNAEGSKAVDDHQQSSSTRRSFPKNVVEPPTPPPVTSDADIIRAQYLPTLSETPFWRPLLAITLSTRPLAFTVLRLSRALPRGLPFYASVSNEDRKARHSFSARIRCMRMNRMTGLAVNLAQVLSGARGGPVGLRFGVGDKGRGLGGENLADPIPWEKRVIRIGVGNWYSRADEVKESLRIDGKEQISVIFTGENAERDKGPFDIYGLDDFGRKIDDKTGEVIAWSPPPVLSEGTILAEYKAYTAQLAKDPVSHHHTQPAVSDDADMRQIIAAANTRQREFIEKRRLLKLKMQDFARTHGKVLATEIAMSNKKVLRP